MSNNMDALTDKVSSLSLQEVNHTHDTNVVQNSFDESIGMSSPPMATSTSPQISPESVSIVTQQFDLNAQGSVSSDHEDISTMNENTKNKNAKNVDTKNRKVKGKQTKEVSNEDSDSDSDSEDLENIKPRTWAGWFLLQGAKILDWMDRIGESVVASNAGGDSYHDIRYITQKEKEFNMDITTELQKDEVVVDLSDDSDYDIGDKRKRRNKQSELQDMEEELSETQEEFGEEILHGDGNLHTRVDTSDTLNDTEIQPMIQPSTTIDDVDELEEKPGLNV